jgi:hypothetical protein
VTFTCNTNVNPTPTPDSNAATVTSCSVDRDATGKISLNIFGTNFRPGAGVTINGETPKKMQFKDVATGSSGAFTRIKVTKRPCKNNPGMIVVQNPGAAPSAGFQCAASSLCSN